MPQNDDGIRIDPPVSEPIASDTTPAATAAADPDDEPPAIRPSPQGFHTGPQAETSPVAPPPNSCWFVFATITAPAARNAATTSESAPATRPA